MNDIQKKYRDIAMRAICESYANKQQNEHISSKRFYYKGLPKKVNADHVADVLEAMGYIKLVKFPDGLEKYIEITDKGRCYFEVKKDNVADAKKRKLWDIILLVIGFLLGLLASNFTTIISWFGNPS